MRSLFAHTPLCRRLPPQIAAGRTWKDYVPPFLAKSTFFASIMSVALVVVRGIVGLIQPSARPQLGNFKDYADVLALFKPVRASCAHAAAV